MSASLVDRDTSFLPMVGRAAALDAARHADFCGSLLHVAEAAGDACPDLTEALTPSITRLRNGVRLPPEAFGLYYDIVDALGVDDLAGAVRAAQALASVPDRDNRLVIQGRGTPANQSLDRVIDSRMGAQAEKFAAVDAERTSEMAARIHAGLDLLRQGIPALHDEISGLVHQVCVAQEPEGAKTRFDGASHYQFWGLLFLNPNFHPDRLAMAEVLAHEAGHSLLFGLTDQEPLVHNPDEDLYPSPLRKDPRPIDGIYHATFVSARMAFAMEALAQSGVLTPEEVDHARTAAAEDRANFASGYSVVREHGDLSQTGQQIMDAAVAWIEATAPAT